MDPKVRAAVEEIKKTLARALKPVVFPDGPVSKRLPETKLADAIRATIENALAPHAEALSKQIKVEPVPAQPGDDPNVFRATLTVPTRLIQHWPADRILAAGFPARAVLVVYGLEVKPIEAAARAVEHFRREEMEKQVAYYLAEREIELRGDSPDWSRRIFFEVSP